MQRPWRLGLLLLVYCWLVWPAHPAQSTELVLFEAMGIERLSRPIPLPDVSLPDPAGTQVSLQSFKGQVVLMNFWTTW